MQEVLSHSGHHLNQCFSIRAESAPGGTFGNVLFVINEEECATGI